MDSPKKTGDDRGLDGADSKQTTPAVACERSIRGTSSSLGRDCDLLDVEDPIRGSLGMALVSMRF